MLPSHISSKFLWGLLILHLIFGAVDLGGNRLFSGEQPTAEEQREALGNLATAESRTERFLEDNDSQSNLFTGIANFVNAAAQGWNMAAGVWGIFKRIFFWDYSFLDAESIGPTLGSIALYGQIFFSVVFGWIVLGLIIQKFWAR